MTSYQIPTGPNFNSKKMFQKVSVGEKWSKISAVQTNLDQNCSKNWFSNNLVF